MKQFAQSFTLSDNPSIVYFVDIPQMPGSGELQEFKNVAEFKTRKDAIDFCIEYFGADENGNICLVTPS